MPRKVDYKCPECEGIFEFMHHPNDEPPPDYCPLCKAYVGDDPLPKVPVLHLTIGTHKGKTPDRLYRQLEESSANRAQEAADLVGADVKEMAAIKITDLSDNSREGDVMAKMKPESASMQALTVRGGGPAPTFQPMTPEQVVATQQAAAALPAAKSASKLAMSIPHRQLIAQKTAIGNMGRG